MESDSPSVGNCTVEIQIQSFPSPKPLLSLILLTANHSSSLNRPLSWAGPSGNSGQLWPQPTEQRSASCTFYFVSPLITWPLSRPLQIFHSHVNCFSGPSVTHALQPTRWRGNLYWFQSNSAVNYRSRSAWSPRDENPSTVPGSKPNYHLREPKGRVARCLCKNTCHIISSWPWALSDRSKPTGSLWPPN